MMSQVISRRPTWMTTSAESGGDNEYVSDNPCIHWCLCTTAVQEAEAWARDAVRLWPAHTAAWLNLCDVLVDQVRGRVAFDLFSYVLLCVVGVNGVLSWNGRIAVLLLLPAVWRGSTPPAKSASHSCQQCGVGVPPPPSRPVTASSVPTAWAHRLPALHRDPCAPPCAPPLSPCLRTDVYAEPTNEQTTRTATSKGKVSEALETLATLKKDFPDAKFEASEKAARIRNTQQ